MENDAKIYGDLSESEYFEFLSEIQDEDEEIQEAQIDNIKDIETNEDYVELAMPKKAKAVTEESDDNAQLEAYYGDNAWRKFGQYFFGKPSIEDGYKKAAKTRQAKRKKLKEDKQTIQRMAFDQTYISLSDNIEDDVISLLISLLTESHTYMVNKYETYINKRLAMLLRPLIPRTLRTCKALYPEAMKDYPGFLYNASLEYGNGKTFWALPDIPYYFKQNTEQTEIQKAQCAEKLLINIDKAVASYNMHYEARQNKELKFASILLRNRVKTYYDLLKLNPFWFNILLNHVKEETESV